MQLLFSRVKAKVHQAGPGLDLLKVVKVFLGLSKLAVNSIVTLQVSKAQARQRTGRAGREREGTCYRSAHNMCKGCF